MCVYAYIIHTTILFEFSLTLLYTLTYNICSQFTLSNYQIEKLFRVGTFTKWHYIPSKDFISDKYSNLWGKSVATSYANLTMICIGREADHKQCRERKKAWDRLLLKNGTADTLLLCLYVREWTSFPRAFGQIKQMFGWTWLQFPINL